MGPPKCETFRGSPFFGGALHFFLGGPCLCHFWHFSILHLCPASTCLNQKNHLLALLNPEIDRIPQNQGSPPAPNWPVLHFFRCFAAFVVLPQHCGFGPNRMSFCGPPQNIGGPCNGSYTWGTLNTGSWGPNSPCSTFWAGRKNNK